MKPRLIFIAIICIIIQKVTLGQDLIYEVPMIRENGILKSTRVVVGFNTKVIDTERGIRIVDRSIHPINDNEVKRLIEALATRYGEPTIIKTIPDRVWEDSLVFNRRTKEWVKVPNRSQSFRIDFPTFIPLDSVIYLLRKIPVVKYAEQTPVILPHYVPDDPEFLNQWHLQVIDAENAWDISRGSDEIRVAIIDPVDPEELYDISTHVDFQLPGGGNKFVHNTYKFGGDHTRWIAGVVGATTDNEIGISSLGWNVSLVSLTFPDGTAETNLPQQIHRAYTPAGGNADILNFSFDTRRDCDGKFCPFNFDDVEVEIALAKLAGIIMVAAAGNGVHVGCPTSGGCDGTPSYKTWPAKYLGVIAVSGTTELDEFFEEWNYGSFVDVSAPGDNILTTAGENSSYTSVVGTSFSAPLVSALAALILSINDFSALEVEEIIKAGAEKVGTIYPYVGGWNDHLGYGRINAYNSLIDAVTRTANENKSTDNAATGINNGRRLVKDQNGDYHLVFTSGNNIFYRKSTDNGNSWSSSVHLSTDGGQNKYPSIATHDNFLFVTWQQYNGFDGNNHNYNIIGKWKNLLDTNWKTSQITTPLVWFASETDPIPVVLAADNVDNNYQSTQNAPEVMIAFRKSDGIYHTNLFYVDPAGESQLERSYEQLGPIHKIPNTLSGYANPSLTINNAGKIMLTCNSSWLLYAFTSTGSSWSAFPGSIFNVGGVIYPKYSSVTIDGLDDFHISWEGFKYTYGSDEILHKKILSNGGTGTPITEFRYTGATKDSHQPSTFGHIDGNGGVSIYWFTEDNEITRVINDGTGWDYSGFVFFPYIQTDASYVNSISKDNPNNYAYCWTSAGESPYNYYTSIYNGIPEGGDDPIATGNDNSITYRSAEFRNDGLDVVLALSLGNFVLIDDEENSYPFNIDKLDENFTFQKFKDILETVMSDTIPNSSNINSITFDYTVTTKNISKIKAGNSNNVKMKFILKNRGNGNSHFNSQDFILSEDSSLGTLSGTFEIPLSGLNQNNYLSVKLKLTGVKQSYLNQAEDINLINTYLYASQSLGKDAWNSNQILTKQFDFELEQNYPNPFNPVTIISFSVPKSSNVSLIIYDVLGREIKSLVNGFRNAGSYEVDFDASGFPSGVYFYRLQSENFVRTNKMLLLK